ncbi:MAG: tRNA adenosine(34) deaminase TadA [Desulfobacterium sp.]|nr:tRNA adenosine(34) deaminase TadA [Desulfobacterium sp.]
MDHEHYIKLALEQAAKARQINEVPVGALLVDNTGNVLARGFNQTISMHDPTAHAEILVLRQTGHYVQNYRLLNTTLYVTIEPCIMCMGAIIHARVERVVFGARDPKWGGAGSVYNLADHNYLNHSVKIVSGVCEQECREMIQAFFREKRKSVAR